MVMKYKYTTLSRTDDFLDSISPIYEESKIMQAIQDACAKSGLLLERATKEVIEQFFPQTCTFTITLWEESVGITPDESVPLEQRRAAVLSRRVKLESLTPERMEKILAPLLSDGGRIEVEEGISKHTFYVWVDGSLVSHFVILSDKIKEIKPSHKSFMLGKKRWHNLFIGMAKRSRRTETHFPKERKTEFDSSLSVGMFKRQVKRMDCLVAFEELTDKTFGMGVFVGGYLGGKVVRKEF